MCIMYSYIDRSLRNVCNVVLYRQVNRPRPSKGPAIAVAFNLMSGTTSKSHSLNASLTFGQPYQESGQQVFGYSVSMGSFSNWTPLWTHEKFYDQKL